MLQKLCVCSLFFDNGGQFKSSFQTSCNDLAAKPDLEQGKCWKYSRCYFHNHQMLNLFIVSHHKMFLKRSITPLLLKYKILVNLMSHVKKLNYKKVWFGFIFNFSWKHLMFQKSKTAWQLNSSTLGVIYVNCTGAF